MVGGAWTRPDDDEVDAEGVPTSFRRTMQDVAHMLGDSELLDNSYSSIHDRRHSQRFSDIQQKFFSSSKRALLEEKLQDHEQRRQRHEDDWRNVPDAGPAQSRDDRCGRPFGHRRWGDAGGGVPAREPERYWAAREPELFWDASGAPTAVPSRAGPSPDPEPRTWARRVDDGYGDGFAGGRDPYAPPPQHRLGAPPDYASEWGHRRAAEHGRALHRSPPRPRSQERAPVDPPRHDDGAATAVDYELVLRRPRGLPEQSDRDRLFLARARMRRWQQDPRALDAPARPRPRFF